MTNPHDLSMGIDEHAVGDTVDLVVLVSFAFSVGLPVMFHTGPFLLGHALLKGLLILVSAESDDSDVFPVSRFCVLFQHFLVVSHRLLAWWTPGCPEIQEDNLPGFMLNRRRLLSGDEADVLNQSHV